MMKKTCIILIALMLISCSDKKKQVDNLWQKVVESKNANEEHEALQNLWSNFLNERIGFAVLCTKDNGEFEKLENISNKDSITSIKVKIWFIKDDIKLVKINNKPKDAENYFLLYRDQ